VPNRSTSNRSYDSARHVCFQLQITAGRPVLLEDIDNVGDSFPLHCIRFDTRVCPRAAEVLFILAVTCSPKSEVLRGSDFHSMGAEHCCFLAKLVLSRSSLHGGYNSCYLYLPRNGVYPYTEKFRRTSVCLGAHIAFVQTGKLSVTTSHT
jgi:hypothetical protein